MISSQYWHQAECSTVPHRGSFVQPGSFREPALETEKRYKHLKKHNSQEESCCINVHLVVLVVGGGVIADGAHADRGQDRRGQLLLVQCGCHVFSPCALKTH